MEVQSQSINIPSDLFLAKPAQAVVLNSQGERIEAPVENVPVHAPQVKQAAPQLLECNYEDVTLWDTPLAGPFDTLWPATDDTGLEHVIISCGHVLKSTHDLARWSEKTGARRVNGPESIDAISDLIIGLELPKAQAQAQHQNHSQSQGDVGDVNLSFLFEGGKGGVRAGGSKTRNVNASWLQKQPSKVISCGPVLKSTHDAATWSEKSGLNAVNSAASAGLLGEVASGQGPLKRSTSGRRINNTNSKQAPLNRWKSLNDASAWAKKKGVNNADASSLSSGLKAGGSLQSGLDTQAGSHIQLDGGKAKESPEKAMQELHLHV